MSAHVKACIKVLSSTFVCTEYRVLFFKIEFVCFALTACLCLCLSRVLYVLFKFPLNLRFLFVAIRLNWVFLLASARYSLQVCTLIACHLWGYISPSLLQQWDGNVGLKKLQQLDGNAGLWLSMYYISIISTSAPPSFVVPNLFLTNLDLNSGYVISYSFCKQNRWALQSHTISIT